MKEFIVSAAMALGAVLLYYGSKDYLGALAQQHPTWFIVIGLALVIGAKPIAEKIDTKMRR